MSTPLLIDRIIFNGVPDCEASYGKGRINKVRCKPYVQIFQQNNLIFSSLDNPNNTLPSLTDSDQPFSFYVGVKVVNDVLIRLRHYHSEEQRDSVCRVYFNTSFISDNYLRVNKVIF